MLRNAICLQNEFQQLTLGLTWFINYLKSNFIVNIFSYLVNLNMYKTKQNYNTQLSYGIYEQHTFQFKASTFPHLINLLSKWAIKIMFIPVEAEIFHMENFHSLSNCARQFRLSLLTIENKILVIKTRLFILEKLNSVLEYKEKSCNISVCKQFFVVIKQIKSSKQFSLSVLMLLYEKWIYFKS